MRMEEVGSLRHQGEQPVPGRLRGWGHQDRMRLEQGPLHPSWPVPGSPCPLESMGEQRTLEQGSGAFPWAGDGQALHLLTWEPSWASRARGDKTSPKSRMPGQAAASWNVPSGVSGASGSHACRAGRRLSAEAPPRCQGLSGARGSRVAQRSQNLTLGSCLGKEAGQGWPGCQVTVDWLPQKQQRWGRASWLVGLSALLTGAGRAKANGGGGTSLWGPPATRSTPGLSGPCL